MEPARQNPLQIFAAEMNRARAAGVEIAEAVSLATVDSGGRPRSRVVLVKGITDRGVNFFTNYTSAKAKELAATPFAAISVYWHPILKQIRVAGPVEKLTEAESDAYFATRPRGSQVGAWASKQSQPLESMEALRAAVDEVEQRYAGHDIPRPPHWGGFRIVADEVEIWTDAQYRLHCREQYRKRDDGQWEMRLLNP